MATSVNLKSGGLVTFSVKVNGTVIPDSMTVYSVLVEKKVGKVSSASIVILDGDAATGTFPASSSAIFVPNADVTIEAGYDNTNKVIFKGIITRQSIKIDVSMGSSLEVECRDAAIRMVVGRKSLTFSNQKDSDIISSIIASYPGVSAVVTPTAVIWPEQVQYYATDWDYILSLAEANGLIVTTINGKITVATPDASPASICTVAYGDGLLEFNADLDSTSQLSSVRASVWDYKTQAVISGEATNDVPGAGNLTSKTLSGVVNLDNYQLQTAASLPSDDLTEWSKAQMIRSEYAKIQGEAKFQGTNLLEPANYITLEGLGDRFSGKHLVSGVTHVIEDGNWITEVALGLSPQWFTQQPDVMAPPAAGLLPGARGLFNGTVKKMFDDPDGQFRILVDVPMFDQNGAGIWARLSNFYSTSGAGAFFMPEVGDEVVLGFLGEDPRYPVILGSLYSSSKIQPYTGLTPTENNALKAIASKSGIYIQFDDENKVLTICTPDKNTFILSDKEKKITLQDDNNNSIVMSSAGIVIKSAKDIELDAAGKVTITGPQGVSTTASGGDVQVKGVNIKENADMEFDAQGGTQATVQGGMQLTLKGAMVMIN